MKHPYDDQASDTVLPNDGWFKAVASNPTAKCVEVNITATQIGVRDSKHPDAGVLRFTPDEWACFLDGAVKGEFNL